MIIAAQKRKSNIVEYVLYMWYVEDVIRANDFDIQRIEASVIQKFQQPGEVKEQMLRWYSGLIGQMQHQELTLSGHLSFLEQLVYDLNDTHLALINHLDEEEYRQLYHETRPYIAELKQKMRPEATEIEACLNGLYGVMLLRLKGEEPSASTVQAISHFSRMLASLSHHYLASGK